MMNNELKDAALSLAIFQLWVEGIIDHNIAVPMLFNIPMLEKYQANNYSTDFLTAFEEAVEYETIRSVMNEECISQTATQIMNGFKKVILNLLKD